MYNFYSDCVSWPRHDVYKPCGLCDMIDRAIDISRRTFLKHVNRMELSEMEENMTYSKHPRQGLTMAGDYHVSYHRSKLHGKTVYYFKHSAIEYVFIQSP